MFKSALTAIALVTASGAYAQGFDITQMSEDERSAFRAEVRAYLMENPEVIIEAVNAWGLVAASSPVGATPRRCSTTASPGWAATPRAT